MSEVQRIGEAPTPGWPPTARAPGDLAALISARMCHDLAGPLGAIANGVELMGLAGLAGSAEMDLIAESVENANARLRFFRVAYGPAPAGQSVARAEITGTLRAVARGGRLSYDWVAPGDQDRREVRAVFLLLQCLESAMPQGGHVTVAQDGPQWFVTGEGPRLRLDEVAWAPLQSPRARAPATAALVQFALLPAALAEIGRPLALKLGPDRITARF